MQNIIIGVVIVVSFIGMLIIGVIKIFGDTPVDKYFDKD